MNVTDGAGVCGNLNIGVVNGQADPVKVLTFR
jgi:hypothetical protein